MMKQARFHYLNVLIPIVAASLLSVLIASQSSKPFDINFGTLLLLGWCSGHFFILLLLAILFSWQRVGETATYALIVANVAVCLVTLLLFADAMNAVSHPTSSTSSLAVLVFPVVCLPAGAIAFGAAYPVIRRLRKNRKKRW